MKKLNYLLVGLLAVATLTTACKKKAAADAAEATEEATCCSKCETEVPEANGVPAYVVINKPQVNLDEFAKDAEGFITLFDGKSFKGWRGYGKSEMPARWVIEDGAIKFSKSGGGEAQEADGGDIMFDYKFKNFQLTFDWKVAKGSNSGVFFLAQEIKGQPIYISSPEYQILDNDNHPDALLGEKSNRKSASLYDMIPAVPQNAKPFGEWNTGGIIVYKGSVTHKQNGANVVEYHLWTPQWKELLQKSKFSQEKWPLAFELLNNLGGANREGYIGLQDHGDDVWYRNIRIKILE
ncbi:glycosyl hydrolase [Bacteroidia bacterium]|nr:glycosyl hydrolase [Bacteroidia bacterium]